MPGTGPGYSFGKVRSSDKRRTSAADEINKVLRRIRFRVATPRHMLIGAHQDEFVPVEQTHFRSLHVQDRQGNVPSCSGFDDAGDVRPWVETKKRVVGTQRVVE